MATTSKKQESTQELLQRAAIKVFAIHGYEGATTQLIAEEANLNSALVHYHFGNKEGLYRASMEKFGKDRLSLAERVLTPAKSSEEFQVRLRLWMEELLSAHVTFPDETTILHRDLMLQWKNLKPVFTSTLLQAFKLLIRFIEEAQKNEIISVKRPAEDIALIAWSSICNICRVDRVNHEIFGNSIHSETYRNRILDSVMQILMQGVEMKK